MIETDRLVGAVFGIDIVVVVIVVTIGARGRRLQRHIVRIVQSLEQAHMTGKETKEEDN